ncbi:MAG: hypothetical protein HQM08_29930 [Candidatus Riflebacteria bacterium]|nr:hypothetical protein [Candidatus Riflebacteria bacterium]
MLVSRNSQENRRFWLKHVTAWHEQGWSRREYARKNGLTITAFDYWCRKLGYKGRITKNSAQPSNCHSISSHLPSDARMRCGNLGGYTIK